MADAAAPRLGCLIMAAGNASRFGENKLFAAYRGKTLLELALLAVPPQLFARVMVVSQYEPALGLARQYGFADGVDALFVDLCKPLQRVIPIIRQRQHLREESFGLERQRMVAKMVVGHDRVTFVFLDTEYRHFCDLLRLGFRI